MEFGSFMECHRRTGGIQAQAFVEALNGGHDARLATAEEGIWDLAVCDAARSASASRREETVAYP